MADVIQLTARARDRAGKGAARAVRREGLVPAVIYGGKETPLTISLEPRELRRRLGQTGFFTTLTDVDVDGTAHRVLARDVQFHPVTDQPLHVDFLRVSENTRITVAVPVLFENEEECPGLKRGGVLNVVRHEVEVDCRADAMPQALSADLANLEIGDSIHISDIDLPDGVVPTITDRDFTVATIAAPTVVRDEALEAEAEAEAEEGEELEEGVEGEEGEAAEEGEEGAAEEGESEEEKAGGDSE
ncbi:MAG TPA: 50S ribosomal protein L25/general stress protein Ctc [Alphaproteobacteria bacterium]|nr:50S ribosomal protein L25/general stress protein Ctc [Alphaproteobacteria bacterium]